MNHRKNIIIITFSILLMQTTQAQEKLSLSNILKQIETQSPELKVYEANIHSLDASAKGAKSWMPPQIATGLFMAPYNPALWKRDASGATGMGQYMISAEQLIPNRSRQNAESALLNASSSVEKELKNASINEIFSAAKTNYAEWFILKKKLRILDQNEKLLNFMLQSTEIRYKNGLGKLNAYYKTKASLGTIQKMRLEIENEINQKRIRLSTLMYNQQPDFDIDTAVSLKTVDTETSALETNRSDIKALDQELKLNNLQQGVERTKLKPEFGFRYDHMFGFGGSPMQYSLMAMVKIPMKWSTRADKASIESLKWKSEALHQQKTALLNEAGGQAVNLLNQIAVKKKQIALYETNILPALRKNFQTTQIAYEQNTEELSVLNEAWETLNMTQLEYLDQTGMLMNLQIELERVLERK